MSRRHATIMEPLQYRDVDAPLLPPPPGSGRPPRQPSVLAQWGWGLWDMVLRLVEFGVKMVGAALLVVVLLVVAVVWGWHHVVEAGVEKLQDVTSTTTTTP